MSDKSAYEELEIDYFPSKNNEKIIRDFLKGLRLLYNGYNKSSELDPEGGAGFHWHIIVEAKGEWV